MHIYTHTQDMNIDALKYAPTHLCKSKLRHMDFSSHGYFGATHTSFLGGFRLLLCPCWG